MIIDGTHAERYSRILARYEKEVYDLETRIEIMGTQNWRETKPKLHYVISLINNVVMYVRDAPLEVKIKLIGLIFPEKIEFDGKNYRTKNMNKLVDLIYQQTSELRGNNKKKRRTEKYLSPCSPIQYPEPSSLRTNLGRSGPTLGDEILDTESG